MAQKHKVSFKKWVFIGSIVLIVVIAVGLYIHHRNQPKISKTPVATIHNLPVPTSGSRPSKTPSSSSYVGSGTVTDNNGQTAAPNTNPSQWTESQGGAITLEQPISGTTIANGTVMSGKATVSQVQFTLIDNQVGVIAQGTLQVVNGTFSGTLHFTPTATTGRLDVYSTQPNGKEINEIEIPVNFNP